MTPNIVAALGTSVVGLVTALFGVFAQVADSGASFAPWASVGGTALAISALSYSLKLLVDGRLVSKPVDELQQASAAREERLLELVADFKSLMLDANERESSLRLLLLKQGRPDQ